MYIWIRDIKKWYPHINNKDIDMVMDIHKPKIYEQYEMYGWKLRPRKLYIKKDIEKIFWPIIKTTY